MKWANELIRPFIPNRTGIRKDACWSNKRLGPFFLKNGPNVLVDVELLRMQAGVGFDENGLAHHLFHLLQPLGG